MNKYIIKKEFRESLYESKGMWMLTISACILSALCFLVIMIKEGSSLAQSDILQYAIKAIMFISLTITMVLGSSVFASEREENTLESLLLTPVSKLSLTFAKYFGVLIVGFALYVISIPYLFAIGWGSGLIPSALIMTFFSSILLLFAFVAISIVFSIVMKSSKASILTSVLILIILTFPAFVQSLFKMTAVGEFFLKIDPVANCFNMMTDMLINKLSFFSLGKYIIPLIIFVMLSILLLVFVSNKVALKGEK